MIDTREQRPWLFEKGIPTTNKKLAVGDYSIAGLTTQFAIERKSWSDFLGCITARRKFFLSQLNRLARLPHGLVVVEGSPSLSLPGRYHATRSAVPYRVVLARVARLTLASPVQILFSANRQEAIEVATQICKEVYESRSELPIDRPFASFDRRLHQVPEILLAQTY